MQKTDGLTQDVPGLELGWGWGGGLNAGVGMWGCGGGEKEALGQSLFLL